MRHAWPLLLSALPFALPAAADEVQVQIVGQDFGGTLVPPGPSPSFDITFDINTLSGQQSYTTFPNGILSGLQGSEIEVTNLTATVNGVSVLNVPSTTASVGGSLVNDSGLIFGGFTFNGGSVPNGLIWDLDIHGAPVTNAGDPLLGLLTSGFANSYPGSEVIFSGYLADASSVTVTPVSVPEPGMLELMVLGLAAIALTRRRNSARAALGQFSKQRALLNLPSVAAAG
jgi:hypothetical protein